MNKKYKNQKGFTLVETLVAISVLSISILGTFTAVQSGLQKSSYAKDQVTAFYLVQEAMEYVRNVRDTNALASINSTSSGGAEVNWLHNLSEIPGDPCYFGNVCKIDSPANTATYCGISSGSCPVLNQDSATSLYGYTTGSGWSATRFKREVQFQNITSGKEIIVTVTISWGSKTIQVKQSFFNNR